jgi:hypothetical protein
LATLTREQIVTIEVLQQRGQSQCETAKVLGVSERSVPYHLRRTQAAADGPRKPSLIGRLKGRGSLSGGDSFLAEA